MQDDGTNADGKLETSTNAADPVDIGAIAVATKLPWVEFGIIGESGIGVRFLNDEPVIYSAEKAREVADDVETELTDRGLLFAEEARFVDDLRLFADVWERIDRRRGWRDYSPPERFRSRVG